MQNEQSKEAVLRGWLFTFDLCNSSELKTV